MNRIDELLEKYFAGITSLQDEKELKNYFSGNNVVPEHQKYVSLFQAFEREKEIKMSKIGTKTVKKVSLRRRIILIYTSVAAACLLVVLVFRYQTTTSENYMIVHGKRINNSEMAQEFANAKIEKSLNVIHKSLASYKDNKEIQEKLQKIEDQIKIKK